MIEVDALSKTFVVHKKAPGLMGSVKSLFVREKVEKRAVREVSFRIDEGEIVGLVGANGAGKTTLVKMLAGIIHPTAGEARVLGYRPWERDNEFRSRIALIMGQKAQLWWDLPAADGFLLLKEIYRIPDDAYRERLAELTRMLDIEKEMQVQVRRLSLGERMKMELIATLLHQPRVVYLDEPTIGLDLTAQRAIRDFILTYRERHRPAMILTSHYMEDIERLCERIMIIRDGEIVYDGMLSEVKRTYATHKIITAHLKRENGRYDVSEELLKRGAKLSEEDGTLRYEVPREQVTHAAAEVLEGCGVYDLSIDEMDIGTIIERIFKGREEMDA
ncbi:MAG: ABC transporter ATP-binding protein [Planctomycetota bacterium]|jgi:ABC-2 type transport system ATP-binding protein